MIALAEAAVFTYKMVPDSSCTLIKSMFIFTLGWVPPKLVG